MTVTSVSNLGRLTVSHHLLFSLTLVFPFVLKLLTTFFLTVLLLNGFLFQTYFECPPPPTHSLHQALALVDRGAGSRAETGGKGSLPGEWVKLSFFLWPTAHLPSGQSGDDMQRETQTQQIQDGAHVRLTQWCSGKDSELPVQGTGAWSSNPGRGIRSDCHN